MTTDFETLPETYLPMLRRRFNRTDWHYSSLPGINWSEHLPENERITINGETYVHWYEYIRNKI